MNVLYSLDSYTMYKVLSEYIERYVKIDNDCKDKERPITISNKYRSFATKTYDTHSKESLDYIIRILSSIDVSKSAFFWVISYLHRLEIKDIRLNIVNIQYKLLLMHCIGAKLAEDTEHAYSADYYINIVGYRVDNLFRLEMQFFADVLEKCAPYSPIDLFDNAIVRDRILSIISDVAKMNICYLHRKELELSNIVKNSDTHNVKLRYDKDNLGNVCNYRFIGY